MAGILLVGALGKMGEQVAARCAGCAELEIAAGIDIKSSDNASFPVFSSFSAIPEDVNKKIDVIVDFSNPAVFDSMLDYIINTKKPAVVCTTGLSDEQVIKLKSVAYETPVFFSANMSLGVNLLCELAAKAAKALQGSFDIEVLEMHHNLKVDAPSGTALMLANTMKEVLDEEPEYVYERHSKREKRKANEIGIHSVRGGNIVGEHQVIFAGNDEVITISHSARSKSLFATGALNAAKFILTKENGMYSMKDLLD